MLRTVFVLAIVAYGAFNVVKGPFYTLLLYLWIAYFRPEMWLWDPKLYLSLNLSWITGIVLVASTILARVRWRFDLRTALLFLFVIQDALSAFLSQYFDFSYFYWRDFVRCAIITYIVSVLVDDPRKVRTMVLVIALSLGFEAAKQGWAQLVLDPGGKNLNSVAIFGDENETAVGLFMLVPMLAALAQTSTSRVRRFGLRFLTGGVVYRAIVTYSRGGFLTAIGLAIAYFARSRNKLRTLIVVGVLAAVIIPVLPGQFWARMATLTVSADQRNQVSEGRLYFWQVATRMAAAHPLFGVGHNAYIPAFNSFDTSYAEFGHDRAVHSSWFGVLADLGYPGLILFLANVACLFVAASRVRALVRNRPDLSDLAIFATALETAAVAFAVGGSFVNFHYDEMLWHFLGLSAAIYAIARRATSPAVAPATLPVVTATALPTMSRPRTSMGS